MQGDTLKSNTNSADKLKAISENDETVMKLYWDNYQKVQTYVLNNNGTADEAKDIYQESFIAVWQNVRSGRFKSQAGSSLEGYIFQVAKYKWLDYLRAKKRNKLVPVEDNISVEQTWNEEEQDDPGKSTISF